MVYTFIITKSINDVYVRGRASKNRGSGPHAERRSAENEWLLSLYQGVSEIVMQYYDAITSGYEQLKTAPSIFHFIKRVFLFAL